MGNPESRIHPHRSVSMVPKVPAAPPSLDGHHPAVSRIWRSLGGPTPASIEALREVGRSKPALYRLIFDEPGRVAVYAKRSPTPEMAVERAVYQEVLPGLPLTVTVALLLPVWVKDEPDSTVRVWNWKLPVPVPLKAMLFWIVRLA